MSKVGMGPMHLEVGFFGLLMLLYNLALFVLFVLVLMFLVSGIRFFKQKPRNDEVLIAKLDELIRIQQEETGKDGG
ncbi:MAG: hypothetical protein GX958_00920 [Desulfitobacterium sp.]|nr:hypothetical protein [Desulfitobacterium sp.]